MGSSKEVISMAKDEGSFLKFVFGLFSGVVSGIVFGLLVAPKPGKEMREDLINKSKELKVYGKEQAVKAAGTIQEKANRISTKLDELSNRGSEVLIKDEIQ